MGEVDMIFEYDVDSTDPKEPLLNEILNLILEFSEIDSQVLCQILNGQDVDMTYEELEDSLERMREKLFEGIVHDSSGVGSIARNG